MKTIATILAVMAAACGGAPFEPSVGQGDPAMQGDDGGVNGDVHVAYDGHLVDTLDDAAALPNGCKHAEHSGSICDQYQGDPPVGYVCPPGVTLEATAGCLYPAGTTRVNVATMQSHWCCAQ